MEIFKKIFVKRAIQYSAIIGLFSILIASGISTGVSAIPEHVPDVAQVKAKPFSKVVIVSDNLRAVAQPLYTTFGDPANYLTGSGGSLDGVGKLILNHPEGTYGCTGGLLWTGEHVLTAAHCVTDNFGNNSLQSGTVTFNGDNGDETIPIDASGTVIHNRWNGDYIKGNDIAILKLTTTASDDITRYDIDRNSSGDIGAIVDKVGYGYSGNGNDGAILGFGDKRNGLNQYDDVADTMYQALGLKPNKDYIRGAILQYDFDNGNSANDAFGFFFNNSDLGLGTSEVNSAPGDSGGPAISNGVIVGITSYGITLTYNTGATSDITPNTIDSTFGEFSADTRVSAYAGFIDDAVGGGSDGGETSEPKCTKGMQKRDLC